MKTVAMFVVVIALIAVAGYFYKQSTTTSPAPTTTMESTEPTTTQTAEETGEDTMAAGEVKEFELEAGSFYFKPNEIRVKQRDTVRITINSVSMMHDFNIDELNVKIPVTPSGESGTVEFTADTKGEFEFYCGVGQHRQNGQTGMLIVE